MPTSPELLDSSTLVSRAPKSASEKGGLFSPGGWELEVVDVTGTDDADKEGTFVALLPPILRVCFRRVFGLWGSSSDLSDTPPLLPPGSGLDKD